MHMIKLNIEYWKDDKLMFESSGAVNVTDKTIPQISKLSKKLFDIGMADIVTENA